MILNDGICTLCWRVNTAEPGQKPVYAPEAIGQSWYGDLEFATNPEFNTELREDALVDRRIRVLRDFSLDRLYYVEIDGDYYKVTRVFNGRDEDSGQLMADISLQRIEGYDDDGTV